MNKTPKEVPGTKLEHMAAKGAHWLLYAVMILMPLTGYFGTGANPDFLFFIEIPKFKETILYHTIVEGWLGLTWQAFEAPMDFIHKKGGAYFVWILVLIHILAAFYHHFIRKDITLKRMVSTSWR